LSPGRGPVLALAVGLPVAAAVAGSQATTDRPDPAALAASVTVDAARVEGRINPRRHGQFSEFMYEGVKFGMHAELLRDRGFEETANGIGLPRHWEREPDDRNDDPALKIRWDETVSYPPGRERADGRVEHSLRVEVTADDGQRRGLGQSRLPVRHGVAYTGSLWARSQTYAGRITLALEADRVGGPSYAAQALELPAGQSDWRRYEFTLTPDRDDPLAKLVILFGGRGALWLDQVSLMPGDAVDGVRRDVFERIQALRPAFIRWPGGNVAQDYHWRWGVGPRDQRPFWVNLSWANELEPSDFGSEEFLRLCRNLGADPHLVVNVEGRGATAEEAAAWVAWAKPFGVKVWEVGNEIWGDWVRGHSDAETYAGNYLRYEAAMRAADPQIRLIAVGDNDMAWNRTVLGRAADRIDYLAVHHYYGLTEMAGDPLNLMARPLHYERFYAELALLLRQASPRRPIKLAINEWNTSLPVPRQHSMESALYAARLMNVFERASDVVELTSVSDLVNGWSGGVIQASRHGVFVTPTYLAIQLYNDHQGTERLASRVVSPTFDTSREGRGVPWLDVVASRSADGRSVYLKAVNTNPGAALTTTFTVRGAAVERTATLDTLSAPSLETANSFATPDAVAVTRSEVAAGASFTLRLPPHSVSVLTLRTR
jgi:alpha-N-arabinofuranosidase